MKYVVYECSYKNGKFYYLSEAELDKGEDDFPRNVLDSIGINNVIHYDNVEDALNEKARIEYETSKYPGTDVNSYFVI